ncbi:MAG: DUF3556 domain-containing protein, partial [Leptospiraceae bacterium]|nr:DUF3556 domain-containing protein [Leptospiraceae bacterium]
MFPHLPDYDPIALRERPFAEQARKVCASWALQGYGSPPSVYLLYVVKVVIYVAIWIYFCSFNVESSGSPWYALNRIFHPIAFQKAVLWSLLFEVLGLGCGSGPLTGRYMPPIGGVLYFLRP